LISELPGPSVNTLVAVAGCLALGVGIALHWRLPFLITAVSAGVMISNLYSREVFHALSIQNATSIFTLAFFVLIGANADLSAFHPENLVYIAAYVVARGAGKISGTWLGCWVTGQEDPLRRTLPKLMLPQAGVAAVEAFYVATVLGADGEIVLGVIIPGLIVFEVIGVLTSERALLKWRAQVSGLAEVVDEEERFRKDMQKGPIPVVSFLHPECLRVPLRVYDKGEAIWELVHTLHAAGRIENPGKVLGIIMERERQGGITLGKGIAIPHGRLGELEKPVVAMGILPEDQPIAFGGPVDEPVEIIYLVLSPAEPPELHLEVLAAIARFLEDRDARVLLRHAKNHEEAMGIIRKFSETDISP
jgi:mannitol/fructose-specific phosphotransferase system IIA component (Ntr-type)